MPPPTEPIIYGRFRRYFGPQLMDFDVSVSEMYNMDTRNPNPALEWAVSSQKGLKITSFFPVSPRPGEAEKQQL